jgi:hypothetical protein
MQSFFTCMTTAGTSEHAKINAAVGLHFLTAQWSGPYVQALSCFCKCFHAKWIKLRNLSPKNTKFICIENQILTCCKQMFCIAISMMIPPRYRIRNGSLSRGLITWHVADAFSTFPVLVLCLYTYHMTTYSSLFYKQMVTSRGIDSYRCAPPSTKCYFVSNFTVC